MPGLTDIDKRRIQFQCRRGMLELDLILLPFMEASSSWLDDTQWSTLARLLNEADPDLYTWLMGYGHCDDEDLQSLIDRIRHFSNSQL